MSPRIFALLFSAFLFTLPSAFAQATPPPFALITRGADARHTAAIGTDGSLWTWGYGGAGVEYAPKRFGTDTNWQAVAAGGSHSLALKTDGTLWAWGNSTYGQYGDGSSGSSTNRSTPAQVGTDTNWQAVAAGSFHSIALKTDGTLWAWGLNGNGQLGDDSQTQRITPVQIGTATDWLAIVAGGHHTLALKSNGTLWAWGEHTDGQLGDGSNTDRWTPTQIGSATNWTSISAGTDHSLALQSDGTLWSWGLNTGGQLGDGSSTSRNSPMQLGSDSDWRTVAAGEKHSIALKTGGSLWAWGLNASGQLGDGSFLPSSSPLQIGTATDWQAISAASVHTSALRSDGSVWAWGSDYYAQLASRSQPVSLDAALGNQTVIAVAAGFLHSAVVKSDGSLWSWGDNRAGQLGDGSTTSRTSPVQVGTATNWLSVAAGSYYTLAIKSNGTLWAWGDNSSGALGDGSKINRSSPVQIGSATTWRSVSVGLGHTVALRTNGTLWAWGENFHGQLGDGTQTERLAPVQLSGTNWTAVSAGQWHTLALKSDGTLWAWGLNEYGQVGDGTFYHPSQGLPIPRRLSPVQIGTATDWTAIAAGDFHSLALKSNGTLWGWGHNGVRQLGIISGHRYSPVQVGTDTDWQSIAAGFGHGLAVKTNGTLWGWGRTEDGQLCLHPRPNHFSPTQLDSAPGWTLSKTGTRWAHTLATRGGRLWGFGLNRDGQLPGGDIGRAVPRRAVPARAAQTLSLSNMTATVGIPLTLSATASSGLPVSYSILSGPATLNGNVLTATAPGEVKLDAWQTGSNGEWLPSPVTSATINVTQPTPLQQWKLTQLGDANAPDSGDPDLDGILTLTEYGLVLSPGTPSQAPAAALFAYPEGKRLHIFVSRDPARNDVTIEVLAADAPSGPWTTVAISELGAPFSGAGYVGGDSTAPGVKTVEVRDTVNVADASQRFMRVQVSRPAP